jgi:hypothetical protein
MTKTRPTITARRMLEADERVAAAHEAGHACVSAALRLPFRKVDIIPGKDRSGRIYGRRKRKAAVFVKTGHNDAARGHRWCKRMERNFVDRCERNIIVDFAGGIAQRRYAPRSDWAYSMGHDGLRPNPCYDDGAPTTYHVKTAYGSDLHHITDRLRRLGRYGDETYRAGLEARAKDLGRELWPAIQRVARALLEHKTLSQAQVRRLMTAAKGSTR